MITGREAHHNGIPRYAERERVDRRRDDFLGSLVTAAGYQTALIGKTHWHTEPSFRAGFENVVWQALMRKDQIRRLGQPVATTGVGFNELATTLSHTPSDLQLSGWAAERAVEFLQLRDRSQPFFLWLSFQDPHPPLAIHEPYFSMYDAASIAEPIESSWSADEDTVPRTLLAQQYSMKVPRMTPEQLRKSRSVYYGMITHMDHQIGRVIGTLQHQHDWESTVVIYLTDHGEMLGDHRSAKKSSFLEASARLPFIVRYPDAWKAEYPDLVGTASHALVELADLLPTICDVAGARVPDDIDGASLVPLLRGENYAPHAQLHGHIGDSHMWRDADYKYLYYTDDGSELLFSADDENDEHPVAQGGPTGAKGDTALLYRYRRALVDHLSEENHEHYDDAADGLLNQQLPRPTERELLARNQAGLAALGWTEFPLTRIQSLH